MIIFDYVDDTRESCISPDGIYIPKGEWFHSNQHLKSRILVSEVKAREGEKTVLNIRSIGDIEIRIGVSRRAYSFAWIGEKHLSSSVWTDTEIELDLSRFQSGNLEISVLALDDSAIISTDNENVVTRIDAESVLYDFIKPTTGLCCEEQVYFRLMGGNIFFSFEDGLVHMGKNTSADLLSYFNAFSASKWYKYTNVRNLSAYIDFQGAADVFLVHKTLKEQRIIARYSVCSAERATFELPIGEYPDEGILGLQIAARRESLLFGGGWLSRDKAVQKVRLGIGITTFRREDAVKSAVSRLVRDIAAHPLYSSMIDITVVDNGRTLSAEDFPGAQFIANRNLGGTGGFTRSLIHYQETGRHTHCLFMDDDASCEASSIFRSMSFIRHAVDHKTSLSGAMLFENIQFQQWENGAWFDGGCHSLKRDFDMRDPMKLVENEVETDDRIYGAWWFFFFPLDEAKNYSLPFFVRGDDIDFSYSNDFKVVSLNGVSCWQQDFKTKESAMTAYLFLRSHVVHHLTIPYLKCPFSKIWRILWGHFTAYNNSYFYGTAACVNLAMKHVMQGPKFWEDNIVPSDVLKQIKELSACEKAEAYDEQELRKYDLAEKNFKTSLLPVFLRRISLNGHLLPAFMVRHTPRDFLYKWMTPNRNRVYLRDQVIMIDEISCKKTVLKFNRVHYLKNLAEFLILALKMRMRYKALIKMYTEKTPVQRTRDFWKNQFGE